MRKTFLALIVGVLAIAPIKLVADETPAATDTNVESANNMSAAETGSDSTPQPASEPTPPPPAPPAAQSAGQPNVTPAATPEQPAAASTNAPPNVDQAVREEILRREEAQTSARAWIEQGQKLYYEGKYEQAITNLEKAVKILPRAKVTEIDYNRATHALTDSYYRLADTAYRAGENAKAIQLAEKSLEYDPSNRPAENILVNAKKAEREAAWLAQHPPPPPPPPPPTETPEFQGKQDEIKKLFREGKLLMNSGQYDEAEKEFKQILVIDPYNVPANEFLTQLSELRETASQAGADAARANMIWQSTDAWVTPVSPPVEVPKPLPGGPLGPSIKTAEVQQKLNDIIFPELNFREAVVGDVVRFLSEESRKLDTPTHTGVNMVLSTGIAAGGGEAAAPPPPAPEGQPPQPQPTGVTVEAAPRISLNLRNTPMIDVLRYVTQLANLKYRIDSSAVVILPTNAPEGEMIIRTYHLNPGVFIPSMTVTTRTTTTTQQTSVSGGGGGGAAQAAALVQSGPSSVLPDTYIAVVGSNQVKQAFIDAGVEFPTNSAIYYYDRTSTIIVRNTPENIDNFERVLAVFNAFPSQIEIETKFIEVSQNDLDELAFQWHVGSYNSGDIVINGGNSPVIPETGFPNQDYSAQVGDLRSASSIGGNTIDALLAANGFGSVGAVNESVMTIRGILTNPQFQVVVQALSQKKSADLLSAPKVTTVSGNQAQIRVAQEFIYPTAYTAPTAVSSAGNVGSAGVATTPSTPSAFASRPVGVVFNVTPSVGADGYTINLTLIPQITDFLGFINYGSVVALSAGANVVTVPNDIKQPLFSTRDVMTSVEVWDGQTVVLGGLIRDDVQKIDDKIPFLGDLPAVGRLFRSKVTTRTKRNLLIFVTARLVDPAGNPIHGRSNP
ncbi:MAG TPA: hypothetical protein VLZ12_10595 [Verrucomicrobiae bacterium]|nr:hypothetical protein [Verrucomicrobiae bacterium]